MERASTNGRLPERALSGVEAARAAYDRVITLLERLDETTGSPVDRAHPLDRIESHLDDLNGKRATLMRFPELHRLETRFDVPALGRSSTRCAAAGPRRRRPRRCSSTSG